MSAEEYEQEYDRLSEELQQAWSFPPNLPALVHISTLREVVLRKWLKAARKEKEEKEEKESTLGIYSSGE